MKQEVEYIAYPRLKHVKVFFDSVLYRNNHLHKEIELCVVTKGAFLFSSGGKRYSVSEGDGILIGSNQAHSIESERRGSIGLFLQISTHFLRDYCPVLPYEEFKTTLLSDLQDPKARSSIFLRSLETARSYYSDDSFERFRTISLLSSLTLLILRSIPHSTMSESGRKKKREEAGRMERILTYVEENFDRPIRLSDLAKQEGITPTHLSHVVSSDFGMTFQAYVNARRLEEAVRLLEEGGKTMLEVSAESGFSDPKYMSRTFQKTFGCKPSEFGKHQAKEVPSSSSGDSGILEHIFTDEEANSYLAELERAKKTAGMDSFSL